MAWARAQGSGLMEAALGIPGSDLPSSGGKRVWTRGQSSSRVLWGVPGGWRSPSHPHTEWKRPNPNHQDLQLDSTSRRCKGGEKGIGQDWDRGRGWGSQNEGSSCMEIHSPPPCGARLNRRASMSNCFKIKISFGTGKNVKLLTYR